MRRKCKAIFAFALALVMAVGGAASQPQNAYAAERNLIKNPNFTQGSDLKVWSVEQGEAKITEEMGEEAIYDSVKCYGKISGRTSNYNCFAQDITETVLNKSAYDYCFYAMLDAEDYKDAPAEQRTVEISPYITVEGETTYGQGLSGDTRKVLEPGVWTKFEGTYTPSWEGKAEKVVIRILEQGTDYGQGEGVMGTYYVTGVQVNGKAGKLLKIDQDAVVLHRTVANQMGSNFLTGTAICNSDLSDVNEMALVTKHFNTVTLGNELKPDSMFGYSNDVCPGTETIEFEGIELEVPKLDFSRAERGLNYFLDWNKEHPDNQIKVRGHVLVWHSQTPEWWFHEDYDKSKPYVSSGIMNYRLEWYIKTMAEHFTAPDSKYHGLFYAWDVVNEAVSDAGPRYRNAGENSSWWAVYESKEYIINAFRFANKYMDPEIDLYYNDYNEYNPTKRQGIVKLLQDVKAAKGTRIDGMGMQGHYQTSGNPSMKDFADSARAFAEVVDKIQITELDMSATEFYDGTEATRESEFTTQGYRYKELFQTVKSLTNENINIVGITVWGVVDKNSWLQTANNVGGASDGKRKQCPLLFDDNYQIKPAFWALADASRLVPSAKTVSIVEAASGGSMKGASDFSFSSGLSGAKVKSIWGSDYVLFKVTVSDEEENRGDRFVVYVSEDGNVIHQKEIKREDAVAVAHSGYESAVKFTLDEEFMKEGNEILFDIVIFNNGEKTAFSDQTFSQDTDTVFYAKATLVENEQVKKEEAEKAEKEKQKQERLEKEKAEKEAAEKEAAEKEAAEKESASLNAAETPDDQKDAQDTGASANTEGTNSQGNDVQNADNTQESSGDSDNGMFLWGAGAVGIVALIGAAVVITKKKKTK